MENWELNTFELILFFGLLQGFVFSVLLFFKRRSYANLFLLIILLCLSFNAFIFLILKLGWYNTYPSLHLLPYGLEFIIGPSIYLFIKASLEDSFRPTNKHWGFFSLILLNYPHSVYHIIYGRTIPHLKLHFVLDNLGYLAFVPLGIFLVLAHREIQLKARKESNHSKVSILRQFIYLCFFISLVFFFRVIGEISYGDLPNEMEYWIHLSLMVGILWIGIMALLDKFRIKRNISKQTMENAQHHLAYLKQLMEKEELYRSPTLNLRKLEERSGLKQKDISLALSQAHGSNFYEFINNYRLAEFQRKLLDPQYAHLSIQGIASDAGFSSKATFHRFFKAKLGCTPNEYKKRVIKQSHC